MSDFMGETEQRFPLEFEPQCPQFAWLQKHLGGWQFGEQDLIPVILDTIGASGMFVEVGAGNGDSLPVTIDRMYARAPLACVLVEIDAESRDSLRELYDHATIVEKISWTEIARSDRQLAVVVIDVDGRDSVIMRGMLDAGCRPCLIVCEHMDRHYSIGTTMPHTIPEWLLGAKLQTGHCIADTAETLHAIANKYAYERIGLNRCNSFFVRRDLFPLLFCGEG